MFDLRRREFITLIGGAAAAWPLAARAQQGERVRRIGVITGGDTPDDPDMQARMAAFLDVLRHLGWSDDRNLRIDYRWPVGDADHIRRYAAELVELAPDVILTTGTATMAPLLQATRTIVPASSIVLRVPAAMPSASCSLNTA
jgi:putative tryptophan/tyrosine transport system substrate-binding protein